MGGMKDKHAAEDIWHLTIDDLLAPPPETPRLGGSGPFVINLSASTAPITFPPKSTLSYERMHVYQVTRTEEGRQRFRLRLGPINSELEADALLASLRERYPGAMTAVAADDDLRAIASATRIAASARPAAKPPIKGPTTPAARPHAPRLPIPSKPVAKNEDLEATGSGWDLDSLLPHLAARAPAPLIKKAPPKRPVEAKPVAAAAAQPVQKPAALATPAPRPATPAASAERATATGAKATLPVKQAQTPVRNTVSAPAAKATLPVKQAQAPVRKTVSAPPAAAPAAEIPLPSIPVLSIPVLRNEVMPGTGEIVPTVVIEKAQAPQPAPTVAASTIIEPVVVAIAPEPVVVAITPEPVAVIVVPAPAESAAAVSIAPPATIEDAPAAACAPIIEFTGSFVRVELVAPRTSAAPMPMPDPFETDWAAILSAPVDATGTRPAFNALLESAVAPTFVTPAPAAVATDDDSGLTRLVAKSNALVESLDGQFDRAAIIPAPIAAAPAPVAPVVVAPAAIEPVVVEPVVVEPVIFATAVVEFAEIEPPSFTSTQTIEQKLATLAGILADVETLPAPPAASNAVPIDADAQADRVPALKPPGDEFDVEINLDHDLVTAVPVHAEPWPEIERRKESRPSLKSATEVLSAIEDIVVVDEANNLENLVEKTKAPVVVAETALDIASSVEVLMLKTSAVLDALDAPAKTSVSRPALEPVASAAEAIVAAPVQAAVASVEVVATPVVEPTPAPVALPMPTLTADVVVESFVEAAAAVVETIEPTVVLEPKESAPEPVTSPPAPVAVVPVPQPMVLALAPDLVPAAPAAMAEAPIRTTSSTEFELVRDAATSVPEAAPPLPAKSNAVPPGAVRGARAAKKARVANKPAKPAATIIAPAKPKAPTVNVAPPAAPTISVAAKSAAPAQQVAQPAAAPAERRVTIDSRRAPAMDSTQTLHALTPLELAHDDESRAFVVQLELSQDEIDPDHVPSHAIFEAYRLYIVMGLVAGKLMHALRLGFFADDVSAQAVAAYLKPFFAASAIKRVSTAERERFAERQVVARKDVGATGMHSVIEMSSPHPLPERRLADLTAGATQQGPAEKSLWSRLVAPLKR